MFALIHETLVVFQRRIEQFLTQAANVDGVLLLEERVLADAGQVVFHGVPGHVEIGLGLLADLGLTAEGGVDSVFLTVNWPLARPARPARPPTRATSMAAP